ncbi:hypothetical protein D3C78_1526320 [compost metagenome]
MVKHLAVQLFRNTLIEAAVTRFHMKHGNFAALRSNDRQAGIGIAIQQQRVRLLQVQDFVRLGNNFSDRLGCRLPDSPKEMVGLTDPQVIEKYLVELVIIVLAGMHQNVLHLLVQLSNDTTHLDQLRSGTDQRHHLKHRVPPGCIPASAATP